MKTLRTLFATLFAAFGLLAAIPPQPVRADPGGAAVGAMAAAATASAKKVGALKGCVLDTSKKGVLTTYPIDGVASGTNGKDAASCYVVQVLHDNMKYAVMFATALIALSGIEYMLSGGSADALKKVKQRVIGIGSGFILFLLIRYIVPVITSGLTI